MKSFIVFAVCIGAVFAGTIEKKTIFFDWKLGVVCIRIIEIDLSIWIFQAITFKIRELICWINKHIL